MAAKVLNPFIMYLREQLTCPMCRGIFKNPRTLPCLHNVCHECLKLLETKSRQATESPIQCPACSLEVDTSDGFTVSELPFSFYIERLKDFVTVTNNNFDVLCRRCKLQHSKHAVACCFQCKSPVCRSCASAHKQTKALKSHEVCNLDTLDIKRLPELLQGPVFCNEHKDEEIEFFCEECLVCVCNMCLQLGTCMHSHIEHVGKVRALQDSSDASKQRMFSALGIMQENALACREEIKKVDQSYRTLERKLIDARQGVHKKIEGMILALKNHEKEIISELDGVYKDHQTAILKHRRGLQQAAEGMRRAQDDVKRVLERNLPVEIAIFEDPVAKHFLRLLDAAKPASSPVKYINADYFPDEDVSSVFSGSSRFGEIYISYTDPSCTVVEGDSFEEKKVLAGERIQFVILTKDSEGKMSYSENDCPTVNIHVDNGSDGKVIPARIEDCANGKYLVSYTPFQAGLYKIEVRVRGDPIQGSPFHIKALTRAQTSNPSSPTTRAIPGKSSYRAVIPFGDLRFKPVQLKGPRGIAVSSRGEIAVADSGNRRVQVFTADGEFLTQFGGPEQTGQATITNPVGVAFDIDGNLVVSDCDSRQIYTFSREGLLVQAFGLDSLEYPMGLCTTREGNITVCDWGSRSVKEFSSDGKLLQEFSYIPLEHHRSGIPARPYYVCQQKDNYLTSMEIGCVCAFDKQGHFLYTVSGKTAHGQESLKLKDPRGLTVDSDENLIVCDSGHHRLHMFTPDGRTILLGDQGRELGQFDRVQDVVATHDGKLYVADLGNDRVQVFH